MLLPLRSLERGLRASADLPLTGSLWFEFVVGQAVAALATAHTKPASSRAIAVIATGDFFPRASRRWNRRVSRKFALRHTSAIAGG